MDYRDIPNKQEKYAWNSVESRLQKVENRPIARFQTEALAPKLAKSIPVTHYKLLSPIKNPGFTPTKKCPKDQMNPPLPGIQKNSKVTRDGVDQKACHQPRLLRVQKKALPTVLRNKGKSVPIAAQAKSNAQRRDGSPLRSKEH
ncbi:hypothetical protein NC653_030149 [Populus alba x Populus x berolinensis]|uniref:Uncharacterized protein n=1 Tax=Populus alba x Populus x berolinensis TaxID=444605 RepID=A0AAD6PZW4_9ROSI|nr:hypothetical protein NC653_030149 [Populus alba x Populus x berolinensis]